MKNLICSVFISLIVLLSGCAGTADRHHDQGEAGSDHMLHESSHSSHDNQHDAMKYTSREYAVTQASQNGWYQLSLFSNESPIPLQKIHSWTLHAENANGQPVENLKIYVSGGMPMHRHGFPTKPLVTEHLGNGDYRVEGIKFNMPGHWEMRFNITEKGKPAGRDTDRIVYEIHLK
ncbi:FixH family protein [Kaarinaea lacus]